MVELLVIIAASWIAIYAVGHRQGYRRGAEYISKHAIKKTEELTERVLEMADRSEGAE